MLGLLPSYSESNIFIITESLWYESQLCLYDTRLLNGNHVAACDWRPKCARKYANPTVGKGGKQRKLIGMNLPSDSTRRNSSQLSTIQIQWLETAAHVCKLSSFLVVKRCKNDETAALLWSLELLMNVHSVQSELRLTGLPERQQKCDLIKIKLSLK